MNDNLSSSSVQLFSIVGIYIHENCAHKKNLQPGYYSLNDSWMFNGKDIEPNKKESLDKNFFGDNISISAIVGQNGSGKSSLIDTLFRIINNLWWNVKKHPHHVDFVIGIIADLYFVIDGEPFTLSCDKETIQLLRKGKPIHYSNKELSEVGELFDKYFFYSVVLNYSLHSLNPSDYKGEAATKDGTWIKNIFHKNDGYSTPIVLNPYRGQNGFNSSESTIDLDKEFSLTIERLSAVLIESTVRNRSFIEGYTLDNIEYQFNEFKVYASYNYHSRYYDESNEGNFKGLKDFEEALKKESFAKKILTGYKCNIDDLVSKITESVDSEGNLRSKKHFPYIFAWMYIVDKAIKIIWRYPSYAQYIDGISLFKAISDLEVQQKDNENQNEITHKENNLYTDALIDSDNDPIKGLTEQLTSDTSHITTKIIRTLNFIKKIDFLKQHDCLTSFDYKKYLEEDLKDINISFDNILNNLPPPFYNNSMTFNKDDGSKKEIPLNAFSSGEKQFMYTLSTVIYHIKNLISAHRDSNPLRFKYRNVNIIFDEIEMCFHPEYQRTFINKLITTIKRLKINKDCNLNIVFATHSPFLLSDIPKSNILYLSKGKTKDENGVAFKDKFINPFGANISDILSQSFFLDNKGFIGDFAMTKIRYIIRFIDKVKRRKNLYLDKKRFNKFRDLIGLIGEPLIKNNLMLMLGEVYNKKEDFIRARINMLEKEMNELKNKK